MYEIYITDALVCGSRNNNTSDRSVLLFTREAGMLWASVRSAREERSKHRYALQDFSLARVSLVRGKAGWRITGSEAYANLYYGTQGREDRTILRNVIRLLKRFLQGESPAPDIFDEVTRTLSHDVEDASRMELVMTLRILHTLGYVAPEKVYEPLITESDITTAYRLCTTDMLARSKVAVENAFSVSHL